MGLIRKRYSGECRACGRALTTAVTKGTRGPQTNLEFPDDVRARCRECGTISLVEKERGGLHEPHTDG